MNFYNTYDVNEKNNLKCTPDNTTNYSGIMNCSKYISSNETINYGIDYNNGKLNFLPINHEFNNINFANSINNNSNEYENVNQCFNSDNCKNKKLYGRYNLSLDEISDKSYSEICQNKKICENNNYNNNYLLQKKCFNDNCNYQLYCECDNKKNIEDFTPINNINFFTPNTNYSFV